MCRAPRCDDPLGAAERNFSSNSQTNPSKNFIQGILQMFLNLVL